MMSSQIAISDGRKIPGANGDEPCAEAQSLEAPALSTGAGGEQPPAPPLLIEPALGDQFKTARLYHQMVGLSLAQGAAFMVLCGVELKRLQRQMGCGRGGDRRSKCQPGTVNFAELAETHAGIPRRTGFRYMEMAAAAKKCIPLLDAEELLHTTLFDLPDLRRTQIIESVRKVTDGHTATQLLIDWGICKSPQGAAGKGGRLGETERPATNEERLAVLTDLSRKDWDALEKLLFAYLDAFTLLSDVEIEAQVASLDTAVKARQTWLRTPAAQRTNATVNSIFTPL